jgi:hypothetical protein
MDELRMSLPIAHPGPGATSAYREQDRFAKPHLRAAA